MLKCRLDAHAEGRVKGGGYMEIAVDLSFVYRFSSLLTIYTCLIKYRLNIPAVWDER